MVLLLCTCPGGTGGPRPVREQCQLLSSTGPGGGLGPGLVLAQAEPHLLATAEGLCFPRPFPQQEQGTCGWCRCQRAFLALELAPLPPPDPQEGWLCCHVPAALALLCLPL